MRGLALGPMELTTLSVKLGSYLGFTSSFILAASWDVIEKKGLFLFFLKNSWDRMGKRSQEAVSDIRDQYFAHLRTL